MNAPVNLLDPVETEGAVSFVIDPQTPLAVLSDTAQADALFTRIRGEIDSFVPDLTTVKGRAAVKALAFKITKTKTAVETARKDTTEGWRAQTDAVNASGRIIKTRLEELEEEARKPLTDWEQAERDRIDAVATRFTAMERAGAAQVDDTADAVSARIAALEAMTFDPLVFQDSHERALATRTIAIEGLQVLRARLVQEEADKAELAALRREREEREAADNARAQAEQAARQAEADAKAATERDAEIARKAAADAQAETERKAQEALATQERAHQVELARLQKEKDDAAAAARAETEAAEARERDRSHKAKILGAIKLAIMAHGGIDNEVATKIVTAVAKRAIPNIHIDF